METEELILFLRGYACGVESNGNHYVAHVLSEASNRLESQKKRIEQLEGKGE